MFRWEEQPSRSNNRSDELLQIQCVTNLAISQYGLLPNAFTIGWQSNPYNPQIPRVSQETFIKRLPGHILYTASSFHSTCSRTSCKR